MKEKGLFLFLVLGASLSSFTLMVSGEDKLKPTEVSTASDSSSHEDSKEKRSQEEILFGNQQNKPSGLVDDVMGSEDEEPMEPLALPLSKSANNSGDDSHDEKEETKRGAGAETSNGVLPDADDWLGTGRSNSILNRDGLQAAGPFYLDDTVDPEEYRRKRQLRKRSLRSSLSQMIRKRARLPRRSMRYKRQADMEEVLSMFGGPRDSYFEEEMKPHIFGGRAQTLPKKRRVPAGEFGGYPSAPYPYVFRHREDGLLSPASLPEAEDNGPEEDADLEDIDGLLLMPPNTRYIDPTQDGIRISPNYRHRGDRQEEFEKWLSRNTVPSLFKVSRRSSPFYPIDYRYIPGFKKRSSFRNAGGLFSGGSDDEGEDLGRWGHVVQVPEAYSTPEDVARLYGLAGQLAEGDEPVSRRAV